MLGTVEFWKILLMIFVVWFASGLVIKSVSKLALQYHFSKFLFSFVILGMLTSTPEIFIGINSVRSGNGQIFAGNLMGGSLVLLTVLLPLLILVGGKIYWKSHVGKGKLLASCAVIASMGLFAWDGKLKLAEGVFLLGAYVVMMVVFEVKNKLVVKLEKKVNARDWKVIRGAILELIVGVLLLVFVAEAIVKEIVLLASVSNKSTYFLSLVFVSIFTNVPELSLIIKSVFDKGTSVAIGDILGSACVNTVLMGIFLLVGGKVIILNNNYQLISVMLMVASGFLAYFAISQDYLNRKFAVMMIFLYGIFLWSELW